MGISNAKSNRSQPRSMRARLRKASCLNNDAYEEEVEDDDAQRFDDHLPELDTALAAEQDPVTTSMPNKEANPQLSSGFFATLPVEVRRMIYAELWRSSNPRMKLHIHANYTGPQLTTTPCHYEPTATYSTRGDETDPILITGPLFYIGYGIRPTARWFWHAWGLRMKWGVHWKCQAQAIQEWEQREDRSKVRSVRKCGWMGCFLSCRRMYAEAIESFFESTQLLFTASEDAHRFFVQMPHSHMSKIRSVLFAFDHISDHLFLQPIRASLTSPFQENRLTAAAPVGWALWVPLMLCVREQLSGLRRLRLLIKAPDESGEGFVETLENWEREGYGWVLEQDGGGVYLETRRGENVLLRPRRLDGFM